MVKKLVLGCIIGIGASFNVVASPYDAFPKDENIAKSLATCSAYVNEALHISKIFGGGLYGAKNENMALLNASGYSMAAMMYSDLNSYKANYIDARMNINKKFAEITGGTTKNFLKYSDWISGKIKACEPNATKAIKSQKDAFASALIELKKPENNSLFKNMQDTLVETNGKHIKGTAISEIK